MESLLFFPLALISLGSALPISCFSTNCMIPQHLGVHMLNGIQILSFVRNLNMFIFYWTIHICIHSMKRDWPGSGSRSIIFFCIL